MIFSYLCKIVVIYLTIENLDLKKDAFGRPFSIVYHQSARATPATAR